MSPSTATASTGPSTVTGQSSKVPVAGRYFATLPTSWVSPEGPDAVSKLPATTVTAPAGTMAET